MNFVILNESEASLERLRRLDPARDWRALNNGVHAWILQTFLLVGRQIGATLTSGFLPDAINIVHNSQLLLYSDSPAGVVVGVRADYPSSRCSHWEIVQNKRQVTHRATWMPHWPQQALLPRLRADVTVRRVGYFGRGVNHYSRWLRFASGFDRVRGAVERCCATAGLDVVSKGPDCWNDYSDVDIAIGIRAFGRRSFDTKPPTKLVNAWRALVPFIGGADSAFGQVGRPGQDYACIYNEETLLSALLRLKQDAEYYRTVIENGSRRAIQFSPERVAERWIVLLDDVRSRRVSWRLGGRR